MAEHDNEDRTEEPTEKRLREARERGQVPRSRELAYALDLACLGVLLAQYGDSLGLRLQAWLRNSLHLVRADLVEDHLATHAATITSKLFLLALPLLVAAVAGSLIAPLLLGGLRFNGKAFLPDFSRLNPLQGLRRVFGLNGVVETFKSLLRLLMVASVGWLMLKQQLPALIGLARESQNMAIAHGVSIAFKITLGLTLVLALLVSIDAPYQLWNHRRQLRMTRQEVRDEHKENEGNPEIRARIRRMQHSLATRRMLEAVPSADAVIVNPTHYAVAISYQAKHMRAPQVVAKGVDLIAQAIRDVATQHRVPIISAPPLARVLYKNVELGREIPVRLYTAVAQVLRFVHQLRIYRRHGGRAPQPPDIHLPEGEE